jgi:hypothetical protein
VKFIGVNLSADAQTLCALNSQGASPSSLPRSTYLIISKGDIPLQHICHADCLA